MPPPLAPSQLAAQKYNEVQNYDELIAAGVGEPIPILTLLVHGEKPEEEISEIDFGRAALAAFFAELPTHAPPVDMTNMPVPVLRVKCLSNTTIVEFRAYAPWAPYSGQYISFDRSGGTKPRTLVKSCQLPLDLPQLSQAGQVKLQGFGDEQTLAWVHQDLSNKICGKSCGKIDNMGWKPSCRDDQPRNL